MRGAFPRLEAERRAPGARLPAADQADRCKMYKHGSLLQWRADASSPKARVWKESELALHDGQNRSRLLPRHGRHEKNWLLHGLLRTFIWTDMYLL